ncbi:hypothetical protein [Nonomuraea typhae]|uniref:hypothetical protein n=1 Tax=Nonomuraea typhae TaxID=2603600 RepID=UPI0012FC9680|nr:hypothetical protein [Nonomuraea typhae]
MTVHFGSNLIDTADFYTGGAWIERDWFELRAELGEASSTPPPSVYQMFTPGYQGWLVSPGAKVGDKPVGYRPAVQNWR